MASLWEDKALAKTLVTMGTPPELEKRSASKSLGSLDDALPMAGEL